MIPKILLSAALGALKHSYAAITIPDILAILAPHRLAHNNPSEFLAGPFVLAGQFLYNFSVNYSGDVI